jgi:single-stranded DNA-specific DHH superfamily exonuclease
MELLSDKIKFVELKDENKVRIEHTIVHLANAEDMKKAKEDIYKEIENLNNEKTKIDSGMKIMQERKIELERILPFVAILEHKEKEHRVPKEK